MEERTGRASCVARMLDFRSYIIAARMAMMSTTYNSAVVAMIIAFALIGLCLFPIWLGMDLMSTWSWATGVQAGTAATVQTVADHIQAAAPASATVMDMTIGQAVAGLITVGITLMPTLFELAFPAVQHPLLTIGLNAAIIFDYITDWGTSWAATAGWSGADNWFVHFLWTAGFNLFVSVGVQAILVLCITIVIFGFLRLISGPVRAATAGAITIVQ